MVSIDTTSGFWMGYYQEAAYASGKGASALDMTILEEGDVSAIDRVISCEIEYSGPNREEESDLGAEMSPTAIQKLNTKPGTITLTCYLQTDDFYDYAISGSMGGLQTSLTLHIDNGIKEQDFFGCVITSWECEGRVGQTTKQTIKFKFADYKDGNTITEIAYNSNAISVQKDVSFTLDSITSANLGATGIVQTITNEYIPEENQSRLGAEHIVYPGLIGRNVECRIDYKDRQSNTWGSGNTTKATADEQIDLNAAAMFDLTIVWHSTLTSTMENLYVPLGGTNSGSRGQHGFIPHSVNVKRGIGFTIA
ncbi:MAG: hypothetical protein ACTSQ8_07875 [Candidatus Helarchaeota archaeon]